MSHRGPAARAAGGGGGGGGGGRAPTAAALGAPAGRRRGVRATRARAAGAGGLRGARARDAPCGGESTRDEGGEPGLTNGEVARHDGLDLQATCHRPAAVFTACFARDWPVSMAGGRAGCDLSDRM